MWCETKGAGLKGKLQDYITYFEGTCEFCLSNMGIQQYLDDVENHLKDTAGYDNETVMLLYYDLGVIEFKLDKLDLALEAWQKALEWAEKDNDTVFIGKIKSYLAIYHYAKGNMGESDKYFNEATAIFTERNLFTELALHYVNILWYKRYDPNKESVLQYLDKAFYYVKKADSVKNGRVYLHLGYIYKTIFGDFIRGIEYLNAARDICQKCGNVEMECMTLHVLADGYMQLYHFDEAVKIYYSLQGERYRNITANLKCMILTNVTTCFLRTGQYDMALNALDEMGFNIDEAQANIREELECVHEWLSAAYAVSTGEDIEDVPLMLEEAEKKFERKKSNFPLDHFEYRLSGTWADYYYSLKDYPKALEYAKTHVELSHDAAKTYEKEAAAKAAAICEAMNNLKGALTYRKMEGNAFDMIERSELMTNYDKVFKSFEAYLNEQKSQGSASRDRHLDPLTGLYNKEYLDDYIRRRSIFASGRDGVIEADIDCFTAYKESYGQEAQEEAIKKVASVVKETVEAADIGKVRVCRVGGDGFVIVLKNTTPETVENLAARIVENVRKAQIHNKASKVSPYITITAGCYTGEIKDDLRLVMDRAAMALYDAKEAGRARVGIYK